MDLLFLTGLALLAGYGVSKLTKRFRLPAVVGYILAGLFLGPSFTNIFNHELVNSLGLISDMALGLVAFVIGSEMRSGILKKHGRGLAAIIFAESLCAFFVVAFLVYLLTRSWPIALIFGAMAPASAPAGTVAVLQEYKAKGPLTNALISVVGLDDGLAIIIYGFAAAVAKNLLLATGSFSFEAAILHPLKEIILSILLGALIGIVFVHLLRKIYNRSEVLIVSLGAIFLTTGLSNHWHLSLILTNLTMGLIMSNMYLHTSRKAFNAVQGIVAPIYVVFFVLAGAHLDIRLLPAMGFLGILYIIGRASGLVGGAYLGATLTKADENIRKYLGLGILSQAGVAIGLALIAVKELTPLGAQGEHIATLVINTIAATTIIFEIIGPITTKIAIEKSGEANRARR